VSGDVVLGYYGILEIIKPPEGGFSAAGGRGDLTLLCTVLDNIGLP
jgi:hypothetical protein